MLILMVAAMMRLVDPRRARLPGDVVFRVAAVVGIAWIGLFALGVATIGSSTRGEDIMGNVVYVIPVAVAAALSVVAALRAAGRQQRVFWGLLAVSNVGWLAGELTWAWYVLVAGRESPFPSLADVFYLGSYAVAIPAVFFAFAPSLRRAWGALLDASIMVAALGFLGWTLLIQPQLEWGASLATATGIAYPLLGVAILMLLVSVGYAGHRGVPASIGLVACGFLVSALTDAAYTYFNVLHAMVPGKWLNVGWQIEAVLFCCAALVVIRRGGREAEPRVRSRDVGLPLVLGGVAVSLGVLVSDLMRGHLGAASAALGLYAVTALIARLLLTTRERSATARRLEHALSQRERAERELEQSVSVLQATLDSTIDGVLVVDVEGAITFYNARFLELWNVPEELMAAGDEMAIRHVLCQLEDPDAFLRRVRELYDRPEETSYDVLTFRDGRIFERSSRPQRLGDRIVGRVWTFHDVTEQRRLEGELRHAQKMEAVGRLAGGVAHDFNNLLTAIIGYADVLRLKLGDSPLQREAASIREASDRAAAVTRQLLAFSRKQMLQPRPVDLTEVVNGMASLLRPLVGEDVELVLETEPQLGTVEVDPNQIEQVVLNLAINARDAMPSGGRLTIKTVNTAGETPQVLLSVGDTGTGMSEETQTRIFEPFFTTKAQGEGTGLGLSTVLGVVEQSGGTIAVESTPGQGTTFTISLPRLTGGEVVATEAGELAVDGARSGRILLVEDEEVVRDLLRDVLAQLGFEVVAATTAEAALEAVAGGDPIDLLLTDIVMPGMNGRELGERLLGQSPGLKVIYMSGYTEERVPGLLGDGAAFLQKPFTMSELAAKIGAMLEPAAAAA